MLEVNSLTPGCGAQFWSLKFYGDKGRMPAKACSVNPKRSTFYSGHHQPRAHRPVLWWMSYLSAYMLLSPTPLFLNLLFNPQTMRTTYSLTHLTRKRSYEVKWVKYVSDVSRESQGTTSLATGIKGKGKEMAKSIKPDEREQKNNKILFLETPLEKIKVKSHARNTTNTANNHRQKELSQKIKRSLVLRILQWVPMAQCNLKFSRRYSACFAFSAAVPTDSPYMDIELTLIWQLDHFPSCLPVPIPLSSICQGHTPPTPFFKTEHKCPILREGFSSTARQNKLLSPLSSQGFLLTSCSMPTIITLLMYSPDSRLSAVYK